MTIITAVLISAVSFAQTKELSEWLNTCNGELCNQKFAKKKLDKRGDLWYNVSEVFFAV